MEKLDENTLAFLRAEHAALRQEALLRIWMQHQVLLAAGAAFAALLALYVLLATFAAASWQHSGARTVPLKTYLRDDLEPRLVPGGDGSGGGWEAALAGMRVRGVIGTCWFVSTKGFFFASQSVATLGILAGPWLLAGTPSAFDLRRFVLLLLSACAQYATVLILRYPKFECGSG